ncbi:MAG TPA: DoxX family protein [Acidimicrobiales bacterium]|jgi:uncharacterized membrane protein YphA (DoxX/SURF4 family)
MSLVRMIARPMLAGMFIYGGIDALRHPEPKAATGGDVAKAVASLVPFKLPEDPVQLVRINGAVQLGAGLLLATGRMPRMSALALAGALAPTTVAGHRFWEAKDPQARRTQRIQFLKNASMFGGLLLASVDTAGNPSLSWRARRASARAVRRAERIADQMQASATRGLGHTADALHSVRPAGAH